MLLLSNRKLLFSYYATDLFGQILYFFPNSKCIDNIHSHSMNKLVMQSKPQCSEPLILVIKLKQSIADYPIIFPMKCLCIKLSLL